MCALGVELFTWLPAHPWSCIVYSNTLARFSTCNPPLMGLSVHVDKDGGGGDGSHGGVFVEGRVGRDQVRTQV